MAGACLRKKWTILRWHMHTHRETDMQTRKQEEEEEMRPMITTIPTVPDGPCQQNSTCWCGDPEG